MFSLSKPLQDCGVENHYKIGKALSSLMKTDCPYAHTKYVNEGSYPQWVYFVVQDEVEALPTEGFFWASDGNVGWGKL